MSHDDKPHQEASVPLGTISECPSCGGDGKLHVAPGQLGPCWRCAGSGRVMAYRETKEQFDARMQKVKAFAAFCDQSEPPSSIAPTDLPGFMRKRIEQACEDAEHPKGMSTHNGMARVHAADIRRLLTLLDRAPVSATGPSTGPLKLDTERQVFFYEQDHYYLSNFSAFNVEYDGQTFATAEHAYHFQRFAQPIPGHNGSNRHAILFASSAHEAFRYAQDHKASQRPDWDGVKVDVMLSILRAKAAQHEYVRRKLLQTGERELVENSWRDPFWGWGKNRDGENMLGRLWMDVRTELRATTDGGTNG